MTTKLSSDINPVNRQYSGPRNINHDEVSLALEDLYRQLGLKKPQVVFFESIVAAEFAMALKNYIYPYFFWTQKIDPFFTAHCGCKSGQEYWEYLESSLAELVSWFKDDVYQPTNPLFFKNIQMEAFNAGPAESLWLNRSLLSLFHCSSGHDCIPRPINIEFLFPPSRLIEQLDYINRNCFCCYYFDQLVLVVKFPVSLKVNSRGSLHCENGPATIWPDGVCTWHLNGTMVPAWVVYQSAADITITDITYADDAMVRSEIINKIGLKKFLEIFCASTIDQAGFYKLVEVNLLQQDDWLRDDLEVEQIQRYLKMRNPSTGEIHIEGVHPNCDTVNEALTWRNGTNEIPVQIT